MAKIPNVSVVVPMHNSERFITELMEGILEQTMQDYELIIVDDCSTDNSCAIVESYYPKFEGKLKLIRTFKNEGAGVKRNIGLETACGKYVFFMDSDDVFTKTALEELFNVAEEYQAEVVYCERYYQSTGFGEDFKNDIHIADKEYQRPPYVDEPTLEKNDMKKRLEDWSRGRFWVTPWAFLFLRKFLVENNIKFQPLMMVNDVGQNFEIVFMAKRLLRVPNICYIRRMRDDSISKSGVSVEKGIIRQVAHIMKGIPMTNDSMEKMDFFKKDLNSRYSVIEKFLRADLMVFHNHNQEDAPPPVTYKYIKKHFAQQMGKHEILMSALISINLELYKNHKKLNEELKNI